MSGLLSANEAGGALRTDDADRIVRTLSGDDDQPDDDAPVDVR